MTIKKYRRRVPTIEAIQWTKNNALEVAAFIESTPLIKSYEIDIAKGQGKITIEEYSPGKELVDLYINVGDYIVRCKDSETVDVYYERVFEDMFEEVDNG